MVKHIPPPTKESSKKPKAPKVYNGFLQVLVAIQDHHYKSGSAELYVVTATSPVNPNIQERWLFAFGDDSSIPLPVSRLTKDKWEEYSWWLGKRVVSSVLWEASQLDRWNWCFITLCVEDACDWWKSPANKLRAGKT